MRTFSRLALMAGLVLPFVTGNGSAQTASGTYTTLYSFDTRTGAAEPLTNVTVGSNGELYGITNFSYGTAFELTPPKAPGGAWAFKVIYGFGPGYPLGNGSNPEAGMVLDSSGTLYGTVSSVDAPNGYGAVFQLTPPTSGKLWTYAELAGFLKGRYKDNGATPWGGVVFGSNGALYGTATVGGVSGRGVVFELSAPAAGSTGWTETVLYSFTGQNGDGANPYTGVVAAQDGTIFGTTTNGGTANHGTAFQLTPPGMPDAPWTQAILHSFTGRDGDGALPSGLSMGKNGMLYGTSFGGGDYGYGTVFELIPPQPGGAWKARALYSFTGQNGDGSGPYSGVTIGPSGALFGTTSGGGAANVGTIFELTPPSVAGGAWSESILHSFTGLNGDGAYPEAGLVFGSAGVLYGTTYGGGDLGAGTVFRFTL